VTDPPPDATAADVRAGGLSCAASARRADSEQAIRVHTCPSATRSMTVGRTGSSNPSCRGSQSRRALIIASS